MTATRAKTWSINDIQAAMRARGSHWWDPDTMRIFGCRVGEKCYNGPGGVFFVSSEWDGFRGQETNKRAYTVRGFDPKAADIRTIGEMGQYPTRRTAHTAALKLAEGDGEAETVRAPHRPVTDREQFEADLVAHGCTPDHGLGMLLQWAAAHAKIQVNRCNIQGAEEECFDQDGNEIGPLAECRDYIRKHAERIGCKGVLFSGDPRGCTVKLVFHDGATNDWGRDGWCVPGA